MFCTFGELVVTLLKILTRTRKRVISRDIRPANTIMILMLIIIIIIMMMMMMVMKMMMKMMMVVVVITKLTWYNVRRYEKGDPGDDNKKSARQIVGDDI